MTMARCARGFGSCTASAADGTTRGEMTMTRARWSPVVVAALALALLATPAGGAPAPGFTLELFTGQVLRLADLAGRPVILLFWAEW
jgi:cytochrome oxidase Cu insertion factor (SCO1/SenC/PrrC family)